MKLFRQVFDFYLDASIHVSLAVFSLLQITGFFFNVQVEAHLSNFVFFGTIVCYNFIKYGVEAEKYIMVSNKYHKLIQVFSFLCFVIAAYNGWFIRADSLLVLFILAILTGLYALPVLPQAKNLRSLGTLKIFMVAFVWSGVTVILPFTELGKDLAWDIWVEVVQRILLVLILMIPFEIRDLAFDKADLNTIPQRLGVTRTKVFGGFLVLFFFFTTFLKDEILPMELISKGMLFLILGVLMLVTKRNQSRYFASFGVESIPIMWWLMIWSLTFYR